MTSKPMFKPGDLVVVRSDYAIQINVQALTGLVMDIRPNHIQVIFLDGLHGYWIPREELQRVSLMDQSVSLTLRRISALFQILQAKGCEFEDMNETNLIVRYKIDRCDLSLIESVQKFLGTDLLGIALEPGGRAYIMLVVHFSHQG